MNTASSQPRFSPTIAISLAILAVSTAAIFIRFAQQEVPSLSVAAYRMGLASLLIAPVFWVSSRRHPFQIQRHQWLLLILAGCFLALHFASWISSLAYTSVASSVVLVTTTPLWVALFSPIFLHERLNRAALLGMAVALTGGILIGLSDVCQLTAAGLTCSSLSGLLEGKAILGDFLALFGAWMAAGYLMVGRRLRTSLGLLPYTFFVYGFSAVILIILALLNRLPLFGFSSSAMVWLLALAVIPQLFGHSTFNWALKHVPAGFVSIFLLGEPIGSTILAIIFLNEIPAPVKLIGAGMILAGIWLSSRGGED